MLFPHQEFLPVSTVAIRIAPRVKVRAGGTGIGYDDCVDRFM